MQTTMTYETKKPFVKEHTIETVQTVNQAINAAGTLLRKIESMKVSEDEKPWRDSIVDFLEGALCDLAIKEYESYEG